MREKVGGMSLVDYENPFVSFLINTKKAVVNPKSFICVAVDPGSSALITGRKPV